MKLIYNYFNFVPLGGLELLMLIELSYRGVKFLVVKTKKARSGPIWPRGRAVKGLRGMGRVFRIIFINSYFNFDPLGGRRRVKISLI